MLLKRKIWLAIFLGVLLAGVAGCGTGEEKKVVIYTSVDQEFAEPVLKKFADKTGIKVLPVYDVEAAKTTGLVNRLLAEKNKPQADVFWNSEFMQTMLLKESGVLASYQSPAAKDLPTEFKDADSCWTAFGGRARVLLVNTQLVPADKMPRSVFDLVRSEYGGEKAALAYPMFGTTATQAAALYAALGAKDGRQFFQDLKDNKVQVVDGNSVVRDLVANGRLAFGWTDSDDAEGAIRKGAPVKIIVPDQQQQDLGTLVIPNTVALINQAPHPATGKQLVDYLLSLETEQELLKNGAIQVSTRQPSPPEAGLGNQAVKRMAVSFPAIYQQMSAVKKELAEIFVR